MSNVAIFLIDDDEDFRTGLAENLRDDGHRVEEYAVPEDLPPLSSLTQPELVVTDYQMSREDGLSFADRFHAAHEEVPIVMITAYGTAHLEAEVARRSYLHLCSKPLDYDTFHRLVGRLTRGDAGGGSS
jgi:two-component system nitrogen regulation response regulator GlnG